jgi:antitoxin (DNA-binding transcriptional repressor) of toxin-antitoxin stability system
MNVGTRELKNRLSHYLRRIREAGESIYVTDRGEVIAELRPVARPSKKAERDVLLALSASGDISIGGRGRFKDFKPIRLRRAKSISQIVLEDR